MYGRKGNNINMPGFKQRKLGSLRKRNAALADVLFSETAQQNKRIGVSRTR